ncbi:MAG: hypothetical protein D6776_10975 [Planctomycetota bacterium]|nr:MAG: hypothetical protein D6776_10975 [Planctomycetota bacterium]
MRLRDRCVIALEGLRVGALLLGRGLRHAHPQRLRGESTAVCRAIARGCWNGHYLMAGRGHLNRFWIRDLAISLRGLIELGLAPLARRSIRWALPLWERAGGVTTTIVFHRFPVDIFTYACDSYPFLLYSLLELGMQREVTRYRAFLQAEAQRYHDALIDPATGAVYTDREFSQTKDTMRFRGTCTAHAMAAWCSRLLDRIPQLDNPLAPYPLRRTLLERFWTGRYFRNDLHTDPPLCSADAGYWPFWCGLVDDPAMLESNLEEQRALGLDVPFPLKYHARRLPELEVGVQRWFLPNYQGDSIWTFFSVGWIELLARVDRAAARAHLRTYETLLQRYGTWWEVFEPDGSGPLRGRLGHGADWGMLWAAQLPGALARLELRR